MSYRRKHIKPKLRKLRPKKRFYRKPLFWIEFSLVGLLVILYIGLFVLFQISRVTVSGNQKIQASDIEATALADASKKMISMGPFSLSTKSLLMVSSKSVSNDLLVKYPELKEANVKKKFPDGIELSVKERSPFAVFCTSDQHCFSIDDGGVLFKEIQDVPADSLVLHKSSSDTSQLGDKAFDTDVIDSIASIKKMLADNFQVQVKEVTLSDFLVVRTSEGWLAYFDPAANMNDQLIKLNLLLKNQISAEERKGLQYIYLQYKDKAYYQ